MTSSDFLKGFHPAVQVTMVICITVVVCWFIYQFYKTIRES